MSESAQEPVVYRTTREQCAAKVVGVVCSGCGGVLEPIETVDNADHPTFWPGCMACSQFDYGVDPKVFRIARKLVESRRLLPYSHLREGAHDYLTRQTKGATSVVLNVLHEARIEGLSQQEESKK